MAKEVKEKVKKNVKKKNKLVDKVDTNKKKFLEVFKKKACNVTQTCDDLKISRTIFYNWYNSDKKFEAEVEDIREGLIDFAETQLVKNIKDGKETSLIFFLKCKGKKRGYIEKQELEISGEIKNKNPLDGLSTEELKKLAKDG